MLLLTMERKRKKIIDSEFVEWSDLDLDSLLAGFTDNERDDIDSESENSGICDGCRPTATGVEKTESSGSSRQQ